jgi:RNA polymerase sigma-70 factor (ECF subfamily)
MNSVVSAESDTDASLVRAVIAGDVEAYGQLYDRYAPLIRAICFDATLNFAQSQDLCQETFIRAYRKLGELRNADAFPAWLIAVTRFVCREWLRSRARDRLRFVGLIPPDQRDVANDMQVADDELRQLHVAISRLATDEQLALRLFYLKEQPADQARRVMNLSRAGFYKVLERARRNLTAMLEPGKRDQP